MQTSKTEKILSANNAQGSMKRGEKWFSEKYFYIILITHVVIQLLYYVILYFLTCFR